MINFRSDESENKVQPLLKRQKKEHKEHPLPDYTAANFTIVIRALQTDKRKKNVLTLSRSVVKTLTMKVNTEWLTKLSDEKSSASAGHVFSGICAGVQKIYDKLDLDIEDLDSIEGTNGIWQVSVPYHTIQYHAMSYYTILYYTIPYHTIPYHIIPYYALKISCSSYDTFLL